MLAITIAGVSLPLASIISMMGKPTTITEVNNYYYNNTIIERYNTTIIEQYNNTIVINNTVIERYNDTIVINNTIIEQYNNTIPSNITMEFYHIEDIADHVTFFNRTYNIISDTIIMLTSTQSNDVVKITITADDWIWNSGFGSSGTIYGLVLTNGTYEITYYSGGPIIFVDISIVLMW